MLLLCCAHFCQLSDRLKGLGCTIPFTHCSLQNFYYSIPQHHTVHRCQSFPLRGSLAASSGIRMFPVIILFILLSFSSSQRVFSTLSFHTELPSYLKSRGKYIYILPEYDRLVHVSEYYFFIRNEKMNDIYILKK